MTLDIINNYNVNGGEFFFEKLFKKHAIKMLFTHGLIQNLTKSNQIMRIFLNTTGVCKEILIVCICFMVGNVVIAVA